MLLRLGKQSTLAAVAAAFVAACAVWAAAQSPTAPAPAAPLAKAEAPANAPAAPALADFEKEIVPLLQKYCYDCHGAGEDAAKYIAIDTFKSTADVLKQRKHWEAALVNVRASIMPPPDADQPTTAERRALVDWIDGTLHKVDPNNPDPGRVTIRRLNRAEYNNTIRDLVGVDFQPADDFPVDDSGYGFDTIGDVLSTPPVLMEKYLAAAEKVLDQAIVTQPVARKVRRVPAVQAEIGFNALGDRGDGWVHLISLEEDDAAVELPVLAPGDYLFRVTAIAKPEGGVTPYAPNQNPFSRRQQNKEEYERGIADGPMRMTFFVGDTSVREFEVTATDESKPGVYEARLGVPAGRQRLRAVARRVRGGAGELVMKNGRLGREQRGILFVKTLEIEGPLEGANFRHPAAALQITGDTLAHPDGSRTFKGNGDATTPFDAPRDGEYLLRAYAYADQAGDEPARMQLRVDGEPVQTFDVLAPGKMEPLRGQRVFSTSLLLPQPHAYETRVKLKPGKRKISAAFVNDFQDPENPNPNLRDRNLTLCALEVVDLAGAQRLPPMPAALARNFARQPTPQTKHEVARETLSSFARRAWRRPVKPAEIDRLMKLFALAEQDGEPFLGSMKLALKGVLVSPHFLFRGETQPDPDNAKAVHPVDEFALASRLSYFLWSTTPDDELLDLAERGALRRNLDGQVRRLLASPRSSALVDNFAGQWLQFRSLDTLAPDKDKFPEFDDNLRRAMAKETQLFFEHVLRADRSVLDFLSADYTFVNERLATFYGIPGVVGDEFRKVPLAGTKRSGVVTHGSVLLMTSNPTRTSPVKRGKWVLENLLGTPPPPPPPDVPQLEEAGGDGKPITGTIRQQMEKHREMPGCASCHALMDPIGFGLENFDGIGRWRDADGGAAVDSAGQLATGESFRGATELTSILASARRDEFTRCIAEKMLTYALGRGTDYYDRPAVEKIAKRLQDNDYRFSTLVREVVHSFPFQMRRGESAAEHGADNAAEAAPAPAPDNAGGQGG